MMRVSFLVTALLALPLCAGAVVFSGQLRSDNAQAILTPPSNSSPVVLHYFIADGTRVKPGQLVLSIDAGQAASDLLDIDAKIAQARTKAAKEIASLRVKAVEAEQKLVQAQAALDTAKVDAAIPRHLIAALDYDKYQAELKRSQHDLALKQRQLDDARTAVRRRVADGKLELEKLQAQHDYDQSLVDTAVVRAHQTGIVVHGFQSVFGNGGRYEEGASSYPGQLVGEIVDRGKMSARAWVLAPDRPGLRVGQTMCLAFDALPGRAGSGVITAISGVPSERKQWGEGRYFAVDLRVEDAAEMPLRPNMSVRIQTPPPAGCDSTVAAPMAMAQQPVQATGEVYARSSAAVMPPQIKGIWQLKVTRMATDGQLVNKGDPIVSFDGGDLMKKLTAKQSELQEKLRQQAKLRLELAVKAKTETVAAAKAVADARKADRKASEPADYVPGVEYKKLIIERRKTRQLEKLGITHAQAEAAERKAEQAQADADVARLRAAVVRLQSAVNELSIKAPRAGIFLHASEWNGDKIDVGSQIWRGQSVARIPDMKTLAVRASLPERDVTRVHRGNVVRINLAGGSGQILTGHIRDIGVEVHSKSRVQPVPVIDLDVTIDPSDVALKPGQPVNVEIQAPPHAKGVR